MNQIEHRFGKEHRQHEAVKADMKFKVTLQELHKRSLDTQQIELHVKIDCVQHDSQLASLT